MDEWSVISFASFLKTALIKDGKSLERLCRIEPAGIISPELTASIASGISAFVDYNLNFFPQAEKRLNPSLDFAQASQLCAERGTALTILDKRFCWHWLQVEHQKPAEIIASIGGRGSLQLYKSAHLFDLFLLTNLSELRVLSNRILRQPRSTSQIQHVSFEGIRAVSLLSDTIWRCHSMVEKFCRAHYESASFSKSFGAWLGLQDTPSFSSFPQRAEAEELKQTWAEQYGNLANDERHRASHIADILHDNDRIVKAIEDTTKLYLISQVFVLMLLTISALNHSHN